MRDSFNFEMIPIIQDNMGYLPGVRSMSSNGYYGYQPPTLEKLKEGPQMETHAPPCRMEVQFENCLAQNHNYHRKRAWEYSNDFREFKKRRQNEKINSNAKKEIERNDDNEDLLEELLRETHGSSFHHWNRDDL